MTVGRPSDETTFSRVASSLDLDEIRRRTAEARPTDLARWTAGSPVADRDLPALFSPAAGEGLEALARRASALTERRFGRVIQLFAPLYLTNECVNKCSYCGFSFDNDIRRRTLTSEEIEQEVDGLADAGFRHVLLVAGESNRHLPPSAVADATRAAARRFASIAVEIAPQEIEEYALFESAGVDGVVVYQETYDPDIYRAVHTKGPKTRYGWRLDAVERAAAAGIRSLGIGALLGLGDWRLEAVMIALHARHLSRTAWRARIAISFPRIRSAAGEFEAPCPVSDREFVHLLTAMRIAVPDAELVVSTREPASLRDSLIGLGITRMSAGSRTEPGGYGAPDESEPQFDIADHRPPSEVAAAIAARGFEPVWKDFDRELTPSLENLVGEGAAMRGAAPR